MPNNDDVINSKSEREKLLSFSSVFQLDDVIVAYDDVMIFLSIVFLDRLFIAISRKR